MKAGEGPIDGLFIITPNIYEDSRGSFYESFNQKIFNKEIGVDIDFVQDNHSKSIKGVLRGLHFQKEPFAQAKLVRTIKGEILDVVVDLRKKSKSFGKYFAIVLSERNSNQLFVPKGFAHGFLVLSSEAEVLYKTDNYYNPEYDSGIIFNDPKLDIQWGLSEKEMILSEKDLNLSLFEDLNILD